MARPRLFNEVDALRAATDQFRDAGYAGTSVGDLTASTGLGKGSLYGAFGSKHALFMRVFDDYCTHAVASVCSELDGPGLAYERVAGHVRATAAVIADESTRRTCMLAKGAAELGAEDEAVRERSRGALEELHAALAQCIAEAQREGSIDESADHAELASLLLAVLRGLEALGEGGVSASMITDAAEQALALLPRATHTRA